MFWTILNRFRSKKKFRSKVFVFTMFSTYYPLFFEKMAVSPEKSQNGNIFEIEIFILKYVFNHSESIPTKKNFSIQNFCLCHFFDLWPRFSKNWLCKVIMGKNFRNRYFRFKTRFGPFRIDSDQKNFSTKNFYLCHYYDLWPHFSKKWLCQVIMGKIFEIEIFVLKYVLDRSKSIPTKNIFGQKFLSLPFFWPKMAKIISSRKQEAGRLNNIAGYFHTLY